MTLRRTPDVGAMPDDSMMANKRFPLSDTARTQAGRGQKEMKADFQPGAAPAENDARFQLLCRAFLAFFLAFLS